MVHALATALLGLSAVGIVLLAVQVTYALLHLHRSAPQPTRLPWISILKPLCGVDDRLVQNLESFGALSYPHYEVLLGLERLDDPAYPIACRVAARWPERMRIVLQHGAPGLNPKVNQLITLARSARHDVLVVSDSNVAVEPEYLHEIAAL